MTSFTESTAPRTTSSKAKLYCRIHPAIGFARVGNSPEEYLVGPESVPYLHSEVAHKDAGDPEHLCLPRVKRRAAHFRVYAYDAADNCLGEITAQSAKSIQWTVKLANTKASSRRIAPPDRDCPEHRTTGLRNKRLPASERWKLNITPQPRTVDEKNTRAIFDDGRFMDIPVTLGEIRTDAEGRLIVLGGSGNAATYDATKRIRNSTDNDGWYDDMSDGPVTASITLFDGTVIDAAPAWIIVGPPDFAPEMPATATQYDVLVDHAIRKGLWNSPERLSFTRDILPILNRIALTQWLDRRGLTSFGDLPDQWAALSQNTDDFRARREAVFAEVAKSYAGREVGSNRDRWLALTPTQFQTLQRWADGRFDSDLQAKTALKNDFGSTPPSPADLDRAALDSYAGDILFSDPVADANFDIVLAGGGFRLDDSKLAAGDLTKCTPCPWHAGFLQYAVKRPIDVLTPNAYEALRAVEAQMAALPRDGSADEQLCILKDRREVLWTTREPWTRALGETSPAREERFIKEWQHLGFVSWRDAYGSDFLAGGGARFFIETERSRYLATMAEYFHWLVNFEMHRDFAPKALELAYGMLGDAKFSSDPKYAPFRYTPEAFDARMKQIYEDFVDNVMYKPVRWESGDITWDGVVDYDEDDEPVVQERVFHIGRASDRALAERFRQMAPLNLTDGAWLQNIATAGPIDGVMSRLLAIWLDEVGNGKPELNHSNVYATLLHVLNIYMPPVTSRDFIEQDFVPSAFESPVFQFCVGLFPRRFLPELLGLTMYVEWEATPTMYPIGKMMATRHIEPQYYSMHAAIDNINVGHGAMAIDAIKLHLHNKQQEGGDSVAQEHWQRIWRGYVGWATLGNGANEVIERMMLVDRKQIHVRSSLLLPSDIRSPFIEALRGGADPLSTFLRGSLSSSTAALLSDWRVEEPPSDELLGGIGRDLNVCVKAGIYEPERFADVSFSAETRKLLKLKPRRGVDLIDLSRSLLEDAYPEGIARRAPFPDIRTHYVARMADLVRRKTPLALQSHRRAPWILKAFHGKPEDMMQALIDRGMIDLEHPAHSPFFAKLEFSGPMYKVFTEEEKATMLDCIEALRTGAVSIVQPEPAVMPLIGASTSIAQSTAEAPVEPGDTQPITIDKEPVPLTMGATSTGESVQVAVDSGDPAQGSFGDKRWRIGMGSVH